MSRKDLNLRWYYAHQGLLSVLFVLRIIGAVIMMIQFINIISTANYYLANKRLDKLSKKHLQDWKNVIAEKKIKTSTKNGAYKELNTQQSPPKDKGTHILCGFLVFV